MKCYAAIMPPWYSKASQSINATLPQSSVLSDRISCIQKRFMFHLILGLTIMLECCVGNAEDIEGCVIGRAIESKGRGMDMELYHSFCFTATTTLMKGGLLVVIY
jgi:hypothetical protein